MMKLLDFLTRGEADLLIKMTNYTFLVLETVRKLKTLVQNLSKDEEEALKKFHEIDLLETQADEVHKKLVEEIAKGNFFSYLREDFLSLLENIDGIADAAKDSSKILVESRLNRDSIKFVFSETKGLEYISVLERTVSALLECIKSLRKEPPSKMLHLIQEVEVNEEKADSIKGEVMKRLYENAERLKLLDVITLKDFLNTADDIADKAEDASDVLLQMIAKGYV